VPGEEKVFLGAVALENARIRDEAAIEAVWICYEVRVSTF